MARGELRNSEHNDVTSPGAAPEAGRSPILAPSGKRILLLECGTFLPREMGIDGCTRAHRRRRSPRPVVASAASPSFTLEDSKLRPPSPRPGIVARSAIVERLTSAPARPVVTVIGPAGYGKTTVLAQWALVEPRVAWVTLDDRDNDPAVLLAYLAAALDRVQRTELSLGRSAVSSGLGLSDVGRIVSAVSSLRAPVIVILDQAEALTNRESRDIVSELALRLPAGSRVALGSRDAACLPVHRLRTRGDLLEIGVESLAMDASEARSVLEGAGVDLSEPDRNELLARTEGWPAGLYLAALAIKAGGPHAGPGVTFSGEDRFVGDYLRMEFLDRVSRADVSFLTRTSILDRLSGPLCDAVTESRGSMRILDRLARSNLMVVPLDRRGEWFRYHHLFQDLLRSELERREPGVIEGLHVRAADWYEANGSPVQAIEHLLLTGEGDRTARAMTPVLPTNHDTGASSTNLRWVSTLGDAHIERYPPLAVLVAWLAATQGDPRKADRWAALVDAAVFDEAPGDGSASFDSARAMLRAIMCAHGPERMLTDALFAVEQEKPWSPWRENALWLLAEAKLLTGATEGARHAFVEASSAAAASSRFDGLLLAEAELALLAMDRGSWDEATDHLRLARATADEHGLQSRTGSGLTSVGIARRALHLGDLKTARAEINRAMQVRPFATYGVPFIAVRLRLWLAKLHFALADTVATRHLLLEIDDILRHRPALGTLVDEVGKFRLDVGSSVSSAVGPAPLSPAELRVLPYLQTHLTLGAIAERLFVSRHTVRSQVTSIYRKLGASSREGAVEQAKAIGLLGG